MKVNTKTIDILGLFSMIRDGIAPEKFVVKRPDDCRYEFRLKQSGKHVGQYITNVDMTLPAMFCDCSVDDILKSEVITCAGEKTHGFNRGMIARNISS